MKVLIACEFSGIVRDEFKRKGHYVLSCDIIPTESKGRHWMGDILSILHCGWDLMIAHPPCTYLACVGRAHFKYRQYEQKRAILFFMALVNAPIGIMSTRYRKPTQIIQPWQFGHGETKATCFWLKNLPKLEPTEIVSGRSNRIHMMGPSKDRSKLRSLTYIGVAQAMAEQWG